MSNVYQDEVIVLKVKDWQTVDRIAEGFSRQNGKVLFIAYGARHMRNRNSALVQNLVYADMQLSRGKKFDTLRQCSLLEPIMLSSDLEKLAYASFISELTSELTIEKEANEEIFLLIKDAILALNKRNSRIVALSFAFQLLRLSGVAPSLVECVACGKEITEDAWINALQGGCICNTCKLGDASYYSESARILAGVLSYLDFTTEAEFSVKGKDLILLEDFIRKFIYIQIGKNLKSLQFIASLK